MKKVKTMNNTVVEVDSIYPTQRTIERALKELQNNKKKFQKKFINIFFEYSWLGNIRELRNIIEYCMNMIEENKIL